MGQVFLDVLGKRGMLAIWSFIIVVQACTSLIIQAVPSLTSFQYVTGAAQGVDASRVVFAFARFECPFTKVYIFLISSSVETMRCPVLDGGRKYIPEPRRQSMQLGLSWHSLVFVDYSGSQKLL